MSRPRDFMHAIFPPAFFVTYINWDSSWKRAIVPYYCNKYYHILYGRLALLETFLYPVEKLVIRGATV